MTSARPHRFGLSAALLVALAAAFAARPAPRLARADDEAPSLARALYLERTARDPKAALPVFEAVRAKPEADATTRADAALGKARCLVALGREAEAMEVWKALIADPLAPDAAKNEALKRKGEVEVKNVPDPDTAAEAKAREAMRAAQEAQEEHDRRLKAAARFVESAEAHLKASRYENAREDLMQALIRNPDDAKAAALLAQVGSHLADRGDVLRQALRFVESSRFADYRRLLSEIEALRDHGKKALHEGRPGEAARAFRDAVDRLDRSDFYADLADRRVEMISYLRRALDESRARGASLDDEMKVPAERQEPREGAATWRSQFFELLGKIFSTRTDDMVPLRFYDAAAPFVADPDAQGVRFSSNGLPSSPAPGTLGLGRARWLERYVRENVAAGTWTSQDRVLNRYDDTLVVQHTASVQKQVEALLRSFALGVPPPVMVDVAVFGAKPGGLAEAATLLGAKALPSESGNALVLPDRLIEEQVATLSTSPRLLLLARASLVLARRHTQTVHLGEATSSCPLYRSGGAPDPEGPRLVIPDRDAQYGLDLEVYAEDLVRRDKEAALSVAALVRRPDRARVLPLSSGEARVPVLLSQTLDADRILPHSGTLLLLGLSNPFAATGAAGDPAGGTHPDLIVLLAVRPAPQGGGPVPVPDVPPNPEPGSQHGHGIVPSDRVTEEYDLGPTGQEIDDDPPPEDWPATPASRGCRPDGARLEREAFLGGWLSERAGLVPGSGTVVVREGKVLATLSPKDHARLSNRIADLAKDEARLFEVSVRSAEVAADRAASWLRADVVRLLPGSGEGAARVYVVEPLAGKDLDARLDRAADASGLWNLDARLAARHTQLATAKSLRLRGIVEDFRVSKRADGSLHATPVQGSAEEGILVSVRPSAYLGGLITLSVGASLSRIERVDPWKPADAPEGVPVVDVPRHQVERVVGAQASLGEGQSLLLAVPAPGAGGARVVLIRASVRSMP